MLKGIIGKKLGMTSFYSPDGEQWAVTVVEAGPCYVTQVKTPKNDGYSALQLGYGYRRPKNITRPVLGHLKKSGKGPFKVLKEFRVEDPEGFELGQELKADVFEIGERVDVTGRSKGRGFTGVIKRWNFGRGPMSHGSKSHRKPGSIGMSATPSRVAKGKKMPGHMGAANVKVRNLRVVEVRPEDNLIFIKGALPGPNNGVVFIKKTKKV